MFSEPIPITLNGTDPLFTELIQLGWHYVLYSKGKGVDFDEIEEAANAGVVIDEIEISNEFYAAESSGDPEAFPRAIIILTQCIGAAVKWSCQKQGGVVSNFTTGDGYADLEGESPNVITSLNAINDWLQKLGEQPIKFIPDKKISKEIYLNVPFQDNEAVKKLGAKWDGETKGWHIDIASDLEAYKKWLPRMYRPGATSPHITCELIPENTWFFNLRSLLPKEEWDRIRKQTYESAGNRCQVCGGRGPKWPVECNEQWQYNHDNSNRKFGVQKLLRLTALCPTCHSIKHAGYAAIKGKTEQTIEQLSFVNGWSVRLAMLHIDEAMKTWEIRSKMTWQFDLSELQNYNIQQVVIDLEKNRYVPIITGVKVFYRNLSSGFNSLAERRVRTSPKL